MIPVFRGLRAGPISGNLRAKSRLIPARYFSIVSTRAAIRRLLGAEVNQTECTVCVCGAPTEPVYPSGMPDPDSAVQVTGPHLPPPTTFTGMWQLPLTVFSLTAPEVLQITEVQAMLPFRSRARSFDNAAEYLRLVEKFGNNPINCNLACLE